MYFTHMTLGIVRNDYLIHAIITIIPTSVVFPHYLET